MPQFSCVTEGISKLIHKELIPGVLSQCLSEIEPVLNECNRFLFFSAKVVFNVVNIEAWILHGQPGNISGLQNVKELLVIFAGFAADLIFLIEFEKPVDFKIVT